MTDQQNQKRGISQRRRNKRFAFLSLTGQVAILSSIFFCTTTAQSAKGLKVGDAAPAVTLTKLLQAPVGAKGTLPELRGKVVVLEFWATWCGPCIPAIDHLSRVAAKYKDQPVQFIFITDEDEKRVNWFLKNKNPNGWVGLDEKRQTIDAYQFVGIPHTVVIDTEGNIAAITSPHNVTEAAISDLLSGKKISIPVKTDEAENLDWDKDLVRDDTLFHAIIRSSNASTNGMIVRQRHLTFDGAHLQLMLQTAFRMPPTRVLNKLSRSQNEQPYSASVAVPKGKEDLLYPSFQRALIDTFGLKVSREKRLVNVFILRRIQNQGLMPRPSLAGKGAFSTSRGTISGKKQPISMLADILEGWVRKPVIDETGLKGNYDWNLPYTYADENILLGSLRSETGLELVPDKRMVEVLVIENELPEP